MTALTSTTDNFAYLFVPALNGEALSARIASRAGGLEADELVASAKDHFINKVASLTISQQTDLVTNLKSQNESYKNVADDVLLSLSKSTSCEITALVCPTPSNQHIGVSLYSDDKGRLRPNAIKNERATMLALECGHISVEVYGDAFVGRYKDDELEDIWERIDFGVADFEDKAWRNSARVKGGGGGSGVEGQGNAASLSSMMAKMNGAQGQGGGQAPNVMDLGAAAGGKAASKDRVVEAETEDFTWNQTNDEVEIVYKNIPDSTTSKDVRVTFGFNWISAKVGSVDFGKKTLGGKVIVDDCVWTIEKGGGGGGKEVMVTLAKQTEGETWTVAVN